MVCFITDQKLIYASLNSGALTNRLIIKMKPLIEKKNLSPGLILVKKRLYLLYGTIVLKKDGRKKRKYLQEKSKLHFKIFAMDECLHTTTNKTYNLNSAYIHYSLEALYKNITPKTAILLQEGWHRCGRDGMTNVKILAKEISYLDDMTKSYS